MKTTLRTKAANRMKPPAGKMKAQRRRMKIRRMQTLKLTDSAGQKM